jgi:hypothetical protein
MNDQRIISVVDCVFWISCQLLSASISIPQGAGVLFVSLKLFTGWDWWRHFNGFQTMRDIITIVTIAHSYK